MRPYLAIIKDSFRAAIASWVLYILLLLITVFLIAIAPFSLTETLTTQVAERDIFPRVRNSQAIDPSRFLRLTEKIVKAADRENPSQRKLIWDKLTPETQQSMRDLIVERDEKQTETDEPSPDDPWYPIFVATVAEEFRADINRVIEEDDLYEEDLWRKERLSPEAQELIDQQGKLSKEKRSRLNRILVSSAFPSDIDRGNETSLELKYAVWELAPIPFRREQVKTQMGSWMPYVLDKGVLAIGVFIAILVTAPMIPQTFDPGSLNLLLSKPVSRSLLLISKFVGGCAFVAICAVYLFVGMWLIFGIRLGIWNNAILISIPIYILVFAIYYSVSASAGVVWRNTVICVIIAVLFWLVCFSVGTLSSMFEGGVGKQQISHLVQTKKETFGVDDIGAIYRWNVTEENWEMVLLEKELQDGMLGLYFASFMTDNLGLRMPLGPVYLEEFDEVVCGQTDFPPQTFNPNVGLIVASAKDGWKTERVAPLPGGTIQMIKDPNGKLLLVTREGNLFRLKTDPLEQYREDNKLPDRVPGAEETTEAPDVADDDAVVDSKNGDEKKDAAEDKTSDKKGTNIFSRILGKAADKDKYFEEVKVQGQIVVGADATVAMNPTNGHIAFVSSRNITFLQPDGDGYKVVEDAEITFPGEAPVTTSAAIGGTHLLAARGNGNLLLYDLSDGSLLETFQPESSSVFRSISGSPDGKRFAVTFANGKLWIVDSSERTVKKANVRGQGDISAAIIDEDDALIVADRTTRLTSYNAKDYSRIDSRSPKLSWTNGSYRYVLHPLYVVCPKPGEFYKLIDHLSMSRSEDVDRTLTNAAAPERSSPWSPLWSGLGFMVVVLFLACIYFERQEF